MGIVTYNKSGSYTGWLGNRMFQAAATIGIADKNGMDYILPPCEYYKYFKGDFHIKEVKDVATLNTINYEEPHFNYDEVILAKENNYNLIGYYQSEKYFAQCKFRIKNLFEFNDEITTRVYYKNRTVLDAPMHKISIHIRRGDYLTLPDHHPVMELGYYRQAVEAICKHYGVEIFPCEWGKKLIFVVFSDDTKWVDDVFMPTLGNMTDHHFINASNPESPVDDMYFMSRCNHNIICNSSFSWWGSYLNKNPNKIVIAPTQDKWFGVKAKDRLVHDMYLDEWTLL